MTVFIMILYFFQSLARLQKQRHASDVDAQFEGHLDVIVSLDVSSDGLHGARQVKWYGARRVPW